MQNAQILDVCQICNQVVVANIDAVETPDGWAHHSCLSYNDGKFHMTGFKYIKPEGVARLYQELDSYGTVGMLWEMDKGEMAELIIDKKNFNYKEYTEDEIMEIHDELTEALSMVIYGFSNRINTLKLGTRAMYNLSAVLEMDLIPWLEPEVCLAELSRYCSEHCATETVNITIRTIGDGYCNQELKFCISGAEEFEVVEEIYSNLCSLYDKVTITLS